MPSAACAAMLFHENRVLLIQHPKYHMWLPPGGHVELGEMLHETLVREILEETGLVARYVRSAALPGVPDEKRLPLPVSVYLPMKFTGRTAEILTYVGIVDSIEGLVLQEREASDHVWLTLDEVDAHPALSEALKVRVHIAWDFLQRYGAD